MSAHASPKCAKRPVGLHLGALDCDCGKRRGSPQTLRKSAVLSVNQARGRGTLFSELSPRNLPPPCTDRAGDAKHISHPPGWGPSLQPKVLGVCHPQGESLGRSSASVFPSWGHETLPLETGGEGGTERVHAFLCVCDVSSYNFALTKSCPLAPPMNVFRVRRCLSRSVQGHPCRWEGAPVVV